MQNDIEQEATIALESPSTIVPSFFWKKICSFLIILGPDLLFSLVMTAILLITVVAVGAHIHFFQASLGLPIGIMLSLIIYRKIMSSIRPNFATNIHHILRDWLPFLFVTFIYENLHDLSGHFSRPDIAGAMYNWDKLLFAGVEPTIWAQKIYAPWFTDVMAFSYALYFIFPLIIMLFLSNADNRTEFKKIALALTFAFLLGFTGYVLWPCSPPRYFITDLYAFKLHGPLLFDRLQAQWDNLSQISCGAFPSLHVAISAIALIYAYKYRNYNKIFKAIWWLYLPMVTSLWFSTVYLRHHWVIDIIAGLIVAAFGTALSEYLLNLWPKLKKRYVQIS